MDLSVEVGPATEGVLGTLEEEKLKPSTDMLAAMERKKRRQRS